MEDPNMWDFPLPWLKLVGIGLFIGRAMATMLSCTVVVMTIMWLRNSDSNWLAMVMVPNHWIDGGIVSCLIYPYVSKAGDGIRGDRLWIRSRIIPR